MNYTTVVSAGSGYLSSLLPWVFHSILSWRVHMLRMFCLMFVSMTSHFQWSSPFFNLAKWLTARMCWNEKRNWVYRMAKRWARWQGGSLFSMLHLLWLQWFGKEHTICTIYGFIQFSLFDEVDTSSKVYMSVVVRHWALLRIDIEIVQ